MDAVDRRDLPLLIELTDPEVEWQSFSAEIGEGGQYRGHPGIEQYVRDLDEAWEILRAEVDRLLDVGDVVLLVGRIVTRGRVSGVQDSVAAGWMVKFRDGRVLRMRAFRHPSKALEAVGLAE